jgi:hypothetical protein
VRGKQSMQIPWVLPKFHFPACCFLHFQWLCLVSCPPLPEGRADSAREPSEQYVFWYHRNNKCSVVPFSIFPPSFPPPPPFLLSVSRSITFGRVTLVTMFRERRIPGGLLLNFIVFHVRFVSNKRQRHDL